MKSVTKALGLLQQFTHDPELKSLGQIASVARLDKATTRRMLLALCEFGLLEQNVKTRNYSIGPAVLPLARAREKFKPVLSMVEPMVQQISTDVGETAHFSVFSQKALSVVVVAQSPKTIRVHISEGSKLPLHTSGAGIAFLAASSDETVERLLNQELRKYTPHSYTSVQAVYEAVAAARTKGYAFTQQTYEEDVCGISTAITDDAGLVAGIISVATPIQRMNKEVEEKIVDKLQGVKASLVEVFSG